MTTRRTTLALLVLSPAAAAQPPLTPEHARILELARTFALQYAKSLPDFLCTQVIRRSEDPHNDNRWRTLDTLTVRLTYSGHEDYTLLLRNGVATELDYRSLAGATSAGEFGTRIADIFDPFSAAEFEWKGWSRVHQTHVAVLEYRVSREHSRNQISYESKKIIAGYHGEIAVDPETGGIFRVTLSADMPAGFPITACSSWTEYDHRDVAGSTYLLPVQSETRLAAGHYRAINFISFRDYRKFQTDTTITFK